MQLTTVTLSLTPDQFCNETEYIPCTNLTNNSDNSSYLPQLSSTLITLPSQLPSTASLANLLLEVGGVRGVVNSSVIDDRITVYNAFLEEIVSTKLSSIIDIIMSPSVMYVFIICLCICSVRSAMQVSLWQKLVKSFFFLFIKMFLVQFPN